MAKKTIKLKLYQNIINEFVAGGVITPGMLLIVGSDAKVLAHNVAGGASSKMFALEDELQGRTIDIDFASGEPVQCAVATPGCEVLAILANGEDVAIGDKLVSNGDGKLKAATSDSSAVVIEEFIIGEATEAVDMSGSSALDVVGGRISIRIL